MRPVKGGSRMADCPASLSQAVLATRGRGRDIVDPAEIRAAAVQVQAFPCWATGGASAGSKAEENR
jgi:hypothetical protein